MLYFIMVGILFGGAIMIYWIYDGDELICIRTSWDSVEKYMNENNYILYSKLTYRRGNDKFDDCFVDVVKKEL